MRRGAILVLACFVLSAGPQSWAAKTDDPAWMRDVTAAGQPCVDVTLAASGRPGIFEKLTLNHQLRFDGVRYVSRVLIVELESRLVPKGENSYEWRTPAGRTLVIDTKSVTRPGRNDWRIVKGVGVDEIAVVGGGTREVFVYARSKLVEYENAGHRYYLNQGTGVCEVSDRRGAVLIRLAGNDDGTRTLSAFGMTVNLKYGQDHELLACSGAALTDMEFSYESGLLVGLKQGDVWRRFEWGAAKYGKYEKAEKKIPPVVIVHGGYKFEYLTNGQTLTGSVHVDGTEMGTWSYSYKTNLHRVTSLHGRDGPRIKTSGP